MIQATKIRKSMLIKMDDMPYVVLKVSHITPGKGRAFVQCVLRGLQNRLSKEVRFRSNDRVEETEIELVEMEYIYFANDEYYFMNLENYEQIAIGADLIGDSAKFLQPNIKVKVEFFENKPFGIVLPKLLKPRLISKLQLPKLSQNQLNLKAATPVRSHPLLKQVT